MPKYIPADQPVLDLAAAILAEYPSHAPTVNAGVRIEYVFALPDLDEDTGEPKNDAIRMSPKDRALRSFEVQILLDKNWWDNHDEAQQAALLDHELHHIAVKEGKIGDDGRPVISMRKHDQEFGWFAVIAHRHGKHSLEQQQARQIVEEHGQFFFPQFCGEGIQKSTEPRQLTSGERVTTFTIGTKEAEMLKKASKALRKRSLSSGKEAA